MTDRDPSQRGLHLDSAERSFWTSRSFLVFLALAAMGILLLWSEHRAHILGALPWLFLLACPLLHVFMHGGHGGHGGHGYRQPGRPFDASKGDQS